VGEAAMQPRNYVAMQLRKRGHATMFQMFWVFST
jgi:hypothetical protein